MEKKKKKNIFDSNSQYWNNMQYGVQYNLLSVHVQNISAIMAHLNRSLQNLEHL